MKRQSNQTVQMQPTHSSQTLNALRNRSVYVSNIVVTVTAAGWCAIGFALGEMPIVYLALFMMGSTTLAILVTFFGHHTIGKILWFFAGLVTITGAFFVSHPTARVEFMYFAVVAGPFLVFSTRYQRGLIVTLLSIAICTWMLAEYLGYDYFGGPYISEEIGSVLRYVVYLTVFAVLAIELLLIGNLTETFNQRLTESEERAIAANQAKSAFLAAMSHEIRTPMNGVVGMMELLDQSPLSHEQKRFLATARRSSYALLRIIDDVLDVSKIDAGKLELAPEKTDLLAQVESTVEVMRGYADERNVTVRFRYDLSLPKFVMMDGGRLGQITLNLLSNAIKFSSPRDRDGLSAPRAEVVVQVTRLGEIQDGRGQFVLEFRDNGIGMDADFMREMFEPFTQSGASTALHFGGTGLGLTIVKQLVDKLDGQIAVQSAVGKGTTIRITLPLIEACETLNCPQLDGWAIHAWANAPEDRATLSPYFEALGATQNWVKTMADLQSLAETAPDKSLFVMVLENADLPDPTQDLGAFSKVKLLGLTRRRGMRTGHLSPDLFVAQIRPLLASDLLAGLRHLTGHPIAAQTPLLSADMMHRPDLAFENAERDRRDIGKTNSPNTKPRILLVEDNEVNQIVLTSQLRLLGYESQIAINGREALAALDQDCFDLILTDCHMPTMNGFEMTREIRARESASGFSKIPIIAITADAVGHDRQKGIDVGMDAYLTKPVRLGDLSKMLSLYLVGEEQGRGAVRGAP